MVKLTDFFFKRIFIFGGILFLVFWSIGCSDTRIEQGVSSVFGYNEFHADENQVTVYYPNTTSAFGYPVFLYIHSNEGSMDEINSRFATLKDHLLSNGIAVASVEFRQPNGETVLFYDAAADCLDAAEWLRQNADDLHINTNKMGVGGFGSGAYFSLLMAYGWDSEYFKGENAPYTDPNYKICLDIAGHTQFYDNWIVESEYRSDFLDELGKLYLNYDAESFYDDIYEANPLNHLDRTKDVNTKLLILYGKEDLRIPYQHYYDTYQSADSCKIDVESISFAGLDHYLEPADENQNSLLFTKDDVCILAAKKITDVLK